MKFTSLKSETVQVLEVPILGKGVDLTNLPENSVDGSLVDCKNVWYNNGRLQSRPGLETVENGIINENVFKEAYSYNYTLTDTTYFYDGSYYNIAMTQVDYDQSSSFIYVYLVGKNGNIKKLGYMHFGRVSADTFFVPYKCMFYKGKTVNGGGIFALVSLRNFEDETQTVERIYEIDENMNSWSVNYDYYIPTFYINGRGNSYELAKLSGIVFENKPAFLQPLNMLTDAFYVYYSSDGYSSDFKLPVVNLSNESIVCRIYYNLTEYTEWIIDASATSAEAEMYTVKIRLTVDRKKGLLNFTSGGGNYAIPQMTIYGENNIRILVKKRKENAFKDIVTSSLNKEYGTRTLFACGNKIYSADYENPLYFPQNPNNAIGTFDSPITALITCDDEIYAFKESEIYKIKLTEGKTINETILLSDNDADFKNQDEYKIECISRDIGCVNSETARSVDGCPVWQAKDGDIYIIRSNRLYNISQRIKPYFEVMPQESVLAEGNFKYYILCAENKAVIMEYNSNSFKGNKDDIAWYIWEFPQDIKIKGIVGNEKTFCFLCVNNKNTCFTTTLSGSRDNVITGTPWNTDIEFSDIECLLKTRNFTFGNFGKRKKISRVYMQLDAENPVEIKVGNNSVATDFKLNSGDFLTKDKKCVKLITNLNNVSDINIELNTSGGFNLGKCEIYFSNLK